MTSFAVLCRPMILLVGQYSTGKTSFIRYLLERDYPGLRIGPEPTTDCFNAVMYGEQEQVGDGAAINVVSLDSSRVSGDSWQRPGGRQQATIPSIVQVWRSLPQQVPVLHHEEPRPQVSVSRQVTSYPKRGCCPCSQVRDHDRHPGHPVRREAAPGSRL